MFRFDPSLVSFEFVMLRRVFRGLNSSVTILEPNTNKEITVPVPFTVANILVNRFSMTRRLIRAVPAAIMYYADHVIAIEQFVYDITSDNIRTMQDIERSAWVPAIKSIYYRYVEPLVTNQDHVWYFDGRYLYRYQDGSNIDTVLSEARMISSDGHFFGVKSITYDLNVIHTMEESQNPDVRECVGFSSHHTQYITPPLWVELNSGRKAAAVMKDSESGSFLFDELDEQLGVNLSFALKAAKYLGQTYGIDYIAPFNLPEAIVQLNTANLMNLPTSVKRTYDIGIPYSHMTSWLMGIMHSETQFTNFVELCNLQRQLITHGTFFKEIFDPRKIYASAEHVGTIPPQVTTNPVNRSAVSLTYSTPDVD